MPIPSQIQRLLEGILNETPDRPMSLIPHDADGIDKLKDANVDVTRLMRTRWSDTDAVTFAIDAKYHVVMWMANSNEDRAYQHSDFDDFFTGGYRDTKVNKGVVGMDWKKYRSLAVWHRGVFGSGERANAKLMMGRLWRETNFVSFWNKKSDVLKEWNLVLDFITNMKLNPKKCVYEFIDQMDVELYDDVTGKSSDGTKDVDPETLRKMHTSPELKKALIGTDTGKKRSFQGVYDRVGDGVIKLGDLLKEDPDSVHATPNIEKIKKMKSLGIDTVRIVRNQVWHDHNDAIPFAFDISNGVMIFSKQENRGLERLVHDDLFGMMSVFADKPHLFAREKKPYGWTITPNGDDEWADVAGPGLSPGPLTFLGLNSDDSMTHYIENDAQTLGGPSRENPKFVFGRLWEQVPLISFWAEKQRSLQPNVLNAVEDMLTSLKIDPKKTVWEFLDLNDELFTYDELDNKMSGTMSKEEYLELLRKQHLDAKAKKALHKDDDVIDKYGGEMAAWYHNKSRTSDGIIKLGDLLK